MNPVLNISSYLFVPLPDAAALRDTLHERAVSAGLKGTILIAEEGINMFLAGDADVVREFIAELKRDERFAPLDPKESWSDHQPFRKMLVKVKNEIIRMNMPAIRPASGRAPAVAPETLRRWLADGKDDTGRPVVTLDTRNDFEVDQGTFRDAIDWRISKFTEFPDALRQHKAELAGKTVVSFCTGGIRCEKAAILMRNEGIENVYQLEGGILKYFEMTDGAHYDGGCFVFDQREVLGANLDAVPLVHGAPPALSSIAEDGNDDLR
ncbi:sulfurtransferase [Diaphorobacter aerolatus]|uniref:tRNA uridine(34) hydroxylase n=1 Tax=Diaphorobacter aerolatus TaxID=1288495 RepID=A0A7H0GKE0_9BURK|nr:sulfurtransferase [Diaphorobacter aerolatus]QNP48756.1 sulfurtransferase [Diaphorobacter aerolatus]